MEIASQQKLFICLGAIFAFTAVSAGAFGAHALKQKLSSDLIDIFEVGVKYQMYHALALIAIAGSSQFISGSFTSAACWLMVIGTLIFSGSLYTLTLTGIRAWGAVTPIGGVLLLMGWLSFIISVLKK